MRRRHRCSSTPARPCSPPDLAASSGCDVLQVDGADHAMTVPGDPVRSAEILVEVTRAMVRFPSG